MFLRLCVLFLAFAGGLPAFAGAAHAQQGGRRVALVVGIGRYEKLPPELSRDTPRADAARVAAALEQAGFDRVRLLTDASATYENVQAVLKEQVSQECGSGDLFLLYFVGQGVGADFDDPRLLFYDTDPDAFEATSLAVKPFARDVQRWVPASSYVILSDAAFDGQFNGLALLGPTGNDWPAFGAHSFVASSASPRQTARPGVFAAAVIEGLGGRADANGDGVVNGSELNGWLVLAVPEATAGKQQANVQGAYDPALEITRRRAISVAIVPTGEPMSTTVVTPLVRVDKAKFVFQGGTSPKVQCGQAPVLVCDPSCYVWDVTSGACRVSMNFEGREVTGQVDVMYRGAYTCGPYLGGVQCSSPPPPSQ